MIYNNQKDYYSVLGVGKSASKAEIDKAYKKLLLQYHPDKNKAPEAKVKYEEISEAYSILGNENKRKDYDSGRSGGFSGFGGSSGFQTSDDIGEDFIDEIFNMFGMGGTRQSNKRQSVIQGEDITRSVTITLEQAFTGCTINFNCDKYCTCESCKGSGFVGSPKECTSCKGRGFVTLSIMGMGYTRSVCMKCNGTGSSNKDSASCRQCNGARRYKKKTTYSIKIPHGIDDGEVIRVSGGGHEGAGSPAGNLLIQVKVEKIYTIPSSKIKFERHHFDLYTSIELPISTIVLGGEKEITGLCDEKIIVNIPKGSNTEQSIVVYGKGMRYTSSTGRGALYVRLVPIVPKSLSGKELALWQELYALENNNQTPPKKSNWW